MKEVNNEEFAIHCGKETDSFEKLEELCNAEAEKLLEKIHVPDGEVVDVPCWTAGLGFPELIGVQKFSKDENGNIVYKLDFSESTL